MLLTLTACPACQAGAEAERGAHEGEAAHLSRRFQCRGVAQPAGDLEKLLAR